MPAAAPLRGLGVLVTRPERQAGALCRLFESQGAAVYRLPALNIVEHPQRRERLALLRDQPDPDLIIFTSANAVRFGEPALAQRRDLQLAAIGPDDAVTKDYRALLANNAAHWRSVANTLGPNALGFVYEYNTNAYAPGAISPWMQNFFVQTYGLLSDLEPLDDMTALNAVRDFLYRVPVGLLGAGTSDYCFTRASTYTINIASGTISDISQAFTSWHDVDVATNGGASACGTTLLGDSGGAPTAAASGYWGNLMPAIAYAVDHGAPGAAAAWSRLSGASNFGSIVSLFNDDPVWSVAPHTLLG